MAMTWCKDTVSGILLSIYVLPKSSKAEVVGVYGSYLKIKLKSPPVDNAANDELINFISKELKIGKKNIKITSGLTNKKKALLVETLHDVEQAYKLIK